MMIYHDKIEKKEINPGVIFQYLGKGKEMMIYHWNMADGSEVAMHTHDSEQFGYCISGGFIIVEDGKNGFLIPEGDETAFAEKGIMLIEDSEKRVQMSVAALERAKDFTEETLMAKWKKLFDRKDD